MSEFDPRLLLDRMMGVSSSRALRDEGYAIVWVRTGAAALLELDEPGNPFSMLILEPSGSGWSVHIEGCTKLLSGTARFNDDGSGCSG